MGDENEFVRGSRVALSESVRRRPDKPGDTPVVASVPPGTVGVVTEPADDEGWLWVRTNLEDLTVYPHPPESVRQVHRDDLSPAD